MKTIASFFVATFLLLFSSLQADSYSLLDQNPEYEITIQNRVLANINGKAITMLDIVKQMDIAFVRQFPEYAENTPARYQYYSMRWKDSLQELINKELILADASELNITVTKGDVRQEIEMMFGPNTIEKLDEAGISMDEAWKLVENDILMRRMTIMRVNNKAVKRITPIMIRRAYEEWLKEYTPESSWSYQVLSVRDADEKKNEESAEAIYQWTLSNDEKLTKENLKEILPHDSTTASLSDEQKHSHLEISPSYKKILNTLNPKEWSHPIQQTSRKNNKKLYRLFYLVDSTENKTPTFEGMAIQLKNRLTQEEVIKQSTLYISKLRKKFAIDASLLEKLVQNNFEPFSIQPKKRA